MKKLLTFIMIVAAALQVEANDRFYIEDFTINPGETKSVSIMLDNEIIYSAFQADLYLPAGLSVVQEDGEYLIDLTDRKGRDHILSSKQHNDGTIRILSYSMGVKPYSGNSGALVIMSIVADDSFTGPASICLRNILFTTQDGEEVAFVDETCNVSIPSVVNLGDVNGDGSVNIADVTEMIDFLLHGDTAIDQSVADVDGDGSITVADVTALIDMLLQNER